MFSHKKSEHIANLFVKEECRNKPHLLLSRRKFPCVYIFCSIPQWKISCLEKNEWHARQPLTFLGITFAVLYWAKSFTLRLLLKCMWPKSKPTFYLKLCPHWIDKKSMNPLLCFFKRKKASWQAYFSKKAFTMWVNKKGYRIEGQVKKYVKHFRDPI